MTRYRLSAPKICVTLVAVAAFTGILGCEGGVSAVPPSASIRDAGLPDAQQRTQDAGTKDAAPTDAIPADASYTDSNLRDATLVDGHLTDAAPVSALAGTLTGTITDPGGEGIAGVRVIAGEQETLSLRDGRYTLPLPVGIFGAVFNGEDYLQTRRKAEIFEGRVTTLDVTLYEVRRPVMINIDEGGRVEAERGASIELEAGSLIDAQGMIVNGEVMISLTEIDPAYRAQATLISDSYLAESEDGSGVLLESFGMVDITIRDPEGAVLQVAPGKTLQLSIPVSAHKGCPEQIGLWSYDDESDFIWKEEGVARCQSLDERCICTGEIPHMSAWNLDEPHPVTCIKGQVQDLTEMPSVRVVEGFGSKITYTNDMTDEDGNFALVVPTNDRISISISNQHFVVVSTDNAVTINIELQGDRELSEEELMRCIQLEEVLTISPNFDPDSNQPLSCESLCQFAVDCGQQLEQMLGGCVTLCEGGVVPVECLFGTLNCNEIGRCVPRPEPPRPNPDSCELCPECYSSHSCALSTSLNACMNFHGEPCSASEESCRSCGLECSTGQAELVEGRCLCVRSEPLISPPCGEGFQCPAMSSCDISNCQNEENASSCGADPFVCQLAECAEYCSDGTAPTFYESDVSSGRCVCEPDGPVCPAVVTDDDPRTLVMRENITLTGCPSCSNANSCLSPECRSYCASGNTLWTDFFQSCQCAPEPPLCNSNGAPCPPGYDISSWDDGIFATHCGSTPDTCENTCARYCASGNSNWYYQIPDIGSCRCGDVGGEKLCGADYVEQQSCDPEKTYQSWPEITGCLGDTPLNEGNCHAAGASRCLSGEAEFTQDPITGLSICICTE